MKRSRYTELEPVRPAPAPAGALDGYVVLEVDEWLEARPPATSALGEHWATVVTPARHLARGFLWLTYTWLRFAVFMAVIGSLALVLVIRIGS